MKYRQAIVHVADIDCRIAPYDWTFARDEAARIDAHWAMRQRATPSLFDGRVLLMHDLAIEDGCLRGRCFETGYKSFLSWRELGFPGAPIANGFAMPALRASDGAFMLGEMSANTSAAGRWYFPAGTPEPSDVGLEGRVDFTANILRELEEETGVTPREITLERGWTIVFDGPTVAFMKRVQTDTTAAELRKRLVAFNATQADPELSDLVPVASRADYDGERMPGFMLRYLDWALAATVNHGSAQAR